MNFNRVATVSALTAVAAIGLAGCQSTQKALGMSKVVPDEFRVVAKAPLAVPPDYALRPPAPGEPRPQELQPESAARAALIGQNAAAGRSEGERLLVARAGSDKADPLIRFVVDDENGDLAHKDESFASKVMFWKKGEAKTNVATAAETGANAPLEIDAAAEEARLKKLVGSGGVVISREKKTGIKLPGL
ncbi:hypothetical protein J2X45_003291 [Caulobacter sp. BE264]|uniref:DUF3035 domain-containing protein n=1 Tax=Caulobacter sp. BE264 TaxID=2817724 RepID=UPI002856F3E1|nr:DUF3035 domain-containing protein [Caulobacter sp. BE264]MDR7232185.1 hypothetical protein [Caulobacter sp. BE264]